ncbi:MAG: hypothetical protein AB1730_16800 [Myxococcota bacterium]
MSWRLGGLVISILALSGCQCVRAPDVTYSCAGDQDCLAGERCVGARCVTDTSDAGGGSGSDAGGDAGATDGGATDGGADAGFEKNCANGMDDDSDGETDCADSDCAGRVCREKAHACDAEESCAANACPADVYETPGTACDDGTPCTAGDQCLMDGGCEGTRGAPIFRCTKPGIIEILSVGSCPMAGELCGEPAPDAGLLARELPDAGEENLLVHSPSAPDGGCIETLPDGGVAIVADVCVDWLLDSAQRPGMCVTNLFRSRVSSSPFTGSVAVYQYRFNSGSPQHFFSLNRYGPMFSQPDPSDPIFYACPP